MEIIAPEFDGATSRPIKVLTRQRHNCLCVELTAENLHYLAKATRALSKSCEGELLADTESEPSEVDESNIDEEPTIDESNIDEEPTIDESNIDAPPVADSIMPHESQQTSDSVSAEAVAVEKQQPAMSVLAMLCRR